MLKTSLRGYQAEGVRRAMEHDGFGLTSEQRTGKTLMSLAIIDLRKPDLVLIITTKKGVDEWNRQIGHHLEVDWPCEIIVSNYEAYSHSSDNRRRTKRRLKAAYEEGFSTFVVCDEAHRIKKRGTRQSRFVRGLADHATYRLALTGTPIAQGLQDAWALFDFLQPGALEHTWAEFSARYLKLGGFRVEDRANPGRTKGTKVVGYRNVKRFDRIFQKYTYRQTFTEARKKEGLGVPKIYRRKHYLQLNPESRRIYSELEEELETFVQDRVISTPIVLTLVMKLQQVTGGYLLDREWNEEDPLVIRIGQEKLEKLNLLLNDIDGKVVICARFRHELDVIEELVSKRGLTYKRIAGGTTFDGKFDTDVIVLQIQSGIAIDLSVSNTYIFYSWDFSYINYEQSRFRVLSFDTKQVNYHYLVAKGTVDEDILESLSKKKDLATLVCDRYRRRHETEQATRGN